MRRLLIAITAVVTAVCLANSQADAKEHTPAQEEAAEKADTKEKEAEQGKTATVKYVDAAEFPLYGKISDETNGRYERLPGKLEGISREPVWRLGRNSSGLYIRFSSNSSQIWAKWTSTFGNHMDHMADTGVRGLDLYVLTDDGWKFVGTGRPSASKESNWKIIANMPREEREYMMYLSLYDGVSALEIGVDGDAEIGQPKVQTLRDDKKIVMYGTSILQGGCASRPGMVHTSILGRMLNREVINLGFSGNALLDMEIAELMASVENPAIYVLDYAPNAYDYLIREKGEAFFRILRDAHPDVPILFIDDVYFAHYGFDTMITTEVDNKNTAQRELFDKLKKSGEKKIYYIARKKTVGDDNEPFVDGIHFTDLGMKRYADFIAPTVRKRMLK